MTGGGSGAGGGRIAVMAGDGLFDLVENARHDDGWTVWR